MYTDCEGLILRQVKTLNGRRMLVLLTKKFGKISAGTSINEKGKNKTALALRPFTYGHYELFKNKDTYNINGAETIESFYSLGENVDKYMMVSYALELTDNLVMEDQPCPQLFNNIYEFLGMLEKRKASFDTLLIGFMLKALYSVGNGPILDTENASCFSIPDGGLIALEPGGAATSQGTTAGPSPLKFELSNDIISAMQFIGSHSLKSLENLALPKEAEQKILKILKAYYAYHLGIENLKSEGLII